MEFICYLCRFKQWSILAFFYVQLTDEAQLRSTIETAISLGYRHIDTAQSFNNEKMIGDILKEQIESGAVAREDLFITAKVCTKYRVEKNHWFFYKK